MEEVGGPCLADRQVSSCPSNLSQPPAPPAAPGSQILETPSKGLLQPLPRGLTLNKAWKGRAGTQVTELHAV